MAIFRAIHQKNYTVVNNTICTDNRLSWKAKGIWLYAFSRKDDWSFYLSDLVKQSIDGKDSVSAGLKELENCGYLKRSRVRDENGRLCEAEWFFHETPHTSTYEPKQENPILDKPILDNPPLISTESLTSTPLPKPAKQKGNAPLPPKSEKGEGKGIGKALPFSKKEKIEKTPPSKQRKFKRSEEHQAAFEWLMSLGLTNQNGAVDEDEISFLSYSYSRQKLENAWCHLLYKTEHEKLKPKCVIALFKHLLKNEHNPIGASNNENIVYAKKFAKKHNWTSLEIKEKYVIDNNYPGKDIPLNISPLDFIYSLENLYNSLR